MTMRFSVHIMLGCCAGVSLLVSCGQQAEASLEARHLAGGLEEASAAAAMSRVHTPTLGSGVNFAETQSFRRCVTTPVISQNPTMEEALYREKRITSSRDLRDTFEADAALSAKGFWGSAHGGLNYFKDVSVDKNAFYWLVRANFTLREDYIDTGSTDFALTQAAQEILREGGLDAFYRACGTHFYSGCQRGAQYALLYEFSSKETQVIGKLAAEASYSGFGVDAQGSFSRFAEMAQRSQMLRIHSQSSGGNHELSSYAESQEHLQSQLASLRHHLMNNSGGIGVSYSVMPYDILPEIAQQLSRGDRLVEAQDFIERHRRQVLRMLFESYERKSDEIKTLDSLLSKCSGDEPICKFSENQESHIRAHIGTLVKDQEVLAARGSGCLLAQQTVHEECSLGADDVAQALERLELPQKEKVPEQDATRLGPWTLVPSFDPYTSRMALSGRHESFLSDAVFFGRGFPFLVHQGTIYYKPRNIAGVGHIAIGRDTSVLHPETGAQAQNICLYDFADLCSLRLIELRPRTETSPPLVKLQLVLFDEHGFVLEKRDFEPYR